MSVAPAKARDAGTAARAAFARARPPDRLGDARASRSTTLGVASGVTSRGAKPVPPVVSTSDAASASPREPPRSRPSSGTTRPHHLEPSSRRSSSSDVAARVLAHTGVHAVGHGQHRRSHAGSFVFSTRRTSSIAIALSTAFAMS